MGCFRSRTGLLGLGLLALSFGVDRCVAQAQSDQDIMSLNVEELARVNVYSASRHEEQVRDAPASVSVITAEEIQRYGWRTLGEVLGSLRGFFTSYDRNYTYLGVRGFLRPGDYNSRILLLIDGHRLNDNVYGSAEIGTEFPLDLDLIDHIEVVRGPGSSLFGTNAVFGVVNIITRRPTSQSAVEASGRPLVFSQPQRADHRPGNAGPLVRPSFRHFVRECGIIQAFLPRICRACDQWRVRRQYRWRSLRPDLLGFAARESSRGGLVLKSAKDHSHGSL